MENDAKYSCASDHPDLSDKAEAQKTLDETRLRRREVMHKAVDILSRREHSYFELERKLQQREYEAEHIDDVLAQLIDQGYLSDRRFAELYIRQRSQKGFGRRDIESWLHARGVDRATVQAAMNADMPDWYELAKTTLIKKCGKSSPRVTDTLATHVNDQDPDRRQHQDQQQDQRQDQRQDQGRDQEPDRESRRLDQQAKMALRLKRRASLTRYLASRGFEPDQIRQALSAIDLD